MKKLLLIAVLALRGAAHAQTPPTVVPFYVDQQWNLTTIPYSFNGVTTNSVPEQWSIQALVNVKYPGTTTVGMSGEYTPQTTRLGYEYEYTTIAQPVLMSAAPMLLASVPGGTPFSVYTSAAGGFYQDPGLSEPVLTDVYGNTIDTSTQTLNPDGTVATAGTMYTTCSSCANLPGYSMPCVSDGVTVYAQDCASDPVNYYGPPITNYVQACALPQSGSGVITQNFQGCAATLTGGPPSIAHSTYQSPAYVGVAPAVDVNGVPVVLTCTTLHSTPIGPDQSCTWTGQLAVGPYLLTDTGASEYCFRGRCYDGQTTVSYPSTVPQAPAVVVPPPPPPCCGDDKVRRD